VHHAGCRWRGHEIDYHSNDRSVPPSIPGRVDGRDLAESIDIVLRAEAAGVVELVETFGRVPVTYCAPGDSWTPATLVAMALLGVKGFWIKSSVNRWLDWLLSRPPPASYHLRRAPRPPCV